MARVKKTEAEKRATLRAARKRHYARYYTSLGHTRHTRTASAVVLTCNICGNKFRPAPNQHPRWTKFCVHCRHTYVEEVASGMGFADRVIVKTLRGYGQAHWEA